MNVSSLNVPILLIEKVFGTYYVGIYSISFRLLSYTNNLVIRGLSEVFLPFMSKSEKDLRKIFSYFGKFTVLMSMIYLPIVLFSKYYIPFLFKSSFMGSSKIISIIGVWLFTVAVVSPYTSIFIARKRAELGLALNTILLITRAGAIMMGRYTGFWISMWIMALIGSFFFTLFGAISHELAGVKSAKNLSVLVSLQLLIIIVSVFVTNY